MTLLLRAELLKLRTVRVTYGLILTVAAPGDKSEPETSRDGGGNQTEDRSYEGSCGHFGEQDAFAVRGGEVSERGAGVAELAACDEDPEHRSENHGPTGEGGDRSLARDSGQRGHGVCSRGFAGHRRFDDGE